MRRRIYNLIFFLFFTILIVFLALIKLNSDSFFSECTVETSMQKLHNVGMIAVRQNGDLLKEAFQDVST